MKNRTSFALFLMFFSFAATAFGQQNIIINDPLKNEKPSNVSAAHENLIKNQILPRARKHWAGNDACQEDFALSGAANGAFTKPSAAQTLVFYQFCQTGNGFGNNGLVLIENGKIIGSYVSEGGWANGISRAPDVNQNGLDEFLVYYSGGMHQGQGGTGADVMEFSGANAIKGLGWFQAESFTEEDGFSYKVSVKPAKIPAYYREKYVSSGDDKWRKSGKIAVFKLGKVSGNFIALK